MSEQPLGCRTDKRGKTGAGRARLPKLLLLLGGPAGRADPPGGLELLHDLQELVVDVLLVGEPGLHLPQVAQRIVGRQPARTGQSGIASASSRATQVHRYPTAADNMWPRL